MGCGARMAAGVAYSLRPIDAILELALYMVIFIFPIWRRCVTIPKEKGGGG